MLINHSLFTARKLRHLPGCLEYCMLLFFAMITSPFKLNTRVVMQKKKDRKYPLAGLVGFLAVNFGSSIMMSVFFRTPWSFLADDFDVPVAVLCWCVDFFGGVGGGGGGALLNPPKHRYLVFFSPFDVGFVVVDFMPVQVFLATLSVRTK